MICYDVISQISQSNYFFLNELYQLVNCQNHFARWTGFFSNINANYFRLNTSVNDWMYYSVYLHWNYDWQQHILVWGFASSLTEIYAVFTYENSVRIVWWTSVDLFVICLMNNSCITKLDTWCMIPYNNLTITPVHQGPLLLHDDVIKWEHFLRY